MFGKGFFSYFSGCSENETKPTENRIELFLESFS